MGSRTFHDPLHRSIRLDGDQPAEAMVLALVDSRPFQRLRRIRQLGPAFLTFHGAESSRFTHSLGVFHLARQALERLIRRDPSLEAQRAVLYASALLHDLGHGPLSHTGEEMFGLRHEAWSARLVRDHPEIRNILDGVGQGTAEAVADLLLHGRAERPVIKSLVSSQLDCDRLDYLLRDSYSTGTRYGQLDLERILSALTLAPDGALAIHPKGLMAVEHYLVVRNLMYRSVYNHRLNVVCNWLLEQLIRTARQLGPERVWSDSTMARWLWDPQALDLDSFEANDDLRTGYHLLRWSEEAPPPLAARRWSPVGIARPGATTGGAGGPGSGADLWAAPSAAAWLPPLPGRAASLGRPSPPGTGAVFSSGEQPLHPRGNGLVDPSRQHQPSAEQGDAQR